MAAWIPVLKALITQLPSVAQIAGSVVPAFTQKSDKGSAPEIISGQIAELQSAITQNAESLKVLAAQVEQLIRGAEVATAKVERDLYRSRVLAISALAVAIVALILAGYSYRH